MIPSELTQQSLLIKLPVLTRPINVERSTRYRVAGGWENFKQKHFSGPFGLNTA